MTLSLYSSLILRDLPFVSFRNVPPELILEAVFGGEGGGDGGGNGGGDGGGDGGDQRVQTLLGGGDDDDRLNLSYFECVDRVLCCLSYSLADLHLPTTDGHKPVATSQVRPFLERVFKLATAVSEHCIAQLPSTELDPEKRVDQAVFALTNVQYVPNSIIDAHQHLDPQWRARDPEAVTAHTVAMAIVQCLTEDESEELCRRCDEVCRLPSLTMIFAAVRGRGCTLLCHKHVAHQLAFGITMDRLDGEKVFCSPLFLLLRPTWRLDDLTDDQDTRLADVMAEDAVPRLVDESPLDWNGIPWCDIDQLQLMFSLRYMLTLRIFRHGFRKFSSEIASLVEMHHRSYELPPPTFVRRSLQIDDARAARDFRRGVVCALEATKSFGFFGSFGATTNTNNTNNTNTKTITLVFMATSMGTHVFARVLSTHNTATAQDPVISAIELEDRLRGALSTLPTRSELQIATARHMAPPPSTTTSLSDYLSDCSFIDDVSKELASLAVAGRAASFAISHACAKRHGVVVMAVGTSVADAAVHG